MNKTASERKCLNLCTIDPCTPAHGARDYCTRSFARIACFAKSNERLPVPRGAVHGKIRSEGTGRAAAAKDETGSWLDQPTTTPRRLQVQWSSGMWPNNQSQPTERYRSRTLLKRRQRLGSDQIMISLSNLMLTVMFGLSPPHSID